MICRSIKNYFIVIFLIFFPFLINCQCNLLYFFNDGPSSIDVYNPVSNSIISNIPTGNNPFLWDIDVTPNAEFIYAAERTSSPPVGINVIETATNNIIATIPINGPAAIPIRISMDLSLDGEFLYVINFSLGVSSSTLSVIQTSTNTVTSTIPLGFSPFDVQVSPNGEFVYVLQPLGISIIETSSNSILTTISVTSPTSLLFSPNGDFYYVTDPVSNSVLVFDTSSNSILTSIPFGSIPSQNAIDITPNGEFIYAANVASNDLSVIEISSNSVIATIPVIAPPTAVKITPNGEFIYVAHSDSNFPSNSGITIFRTSDNSIVNTFNSGIFPTLDLVVSPINTNDSCLDTSSIPTMGEWALINLVFLLLIFGIVEIKNQHILSSIMLEHS